MRTHKVDLSHGDGAHSDLVKGTREEGSKGTAEDNVPVTTGQPNAHTTDVLLCDEALYVAIGEGILVGEGEGGVLSVTVQGKDSLVVLTQLDQSIAIHFTCGKLREGERRGEGGGKGERSGEGEVE